MQFQAKGGELVLNGKSYGLADWQIAAKEPRIGTEPPPYTQMLEGTVNFNIKSFLLPCAYSFTLSNGYSATCKGVVNLVAWRAYLYVEEFDVYQLVNVIDEPRDDDPTAKGVEFVAIATDLEAAKKWIVGD